MSFLDTLPELDFVKDVPEISPEVMALLEQPSTLARRSQVREVVLTWGYSFLMARTVFVLYLSDSGERMVMVREHPSLIQHRHVARYAFGAGPVHLSLLPMVLRGFNYCKRCQQGDPKKKHNPMCIELHSYNISIASEVFEQYRYNEHLCSVENCAVCDKVCPVHQKVGPCRFCTICHSQHGCRQCCECNGIQCKHTVRHDVLIQEKLCVAVLEAQYNVEQGLMELMRTARLSDDTIDSMKWMFTHLQPSGFHLRGEVWHWLLWKKSGRSAMTALVTLLRYQKRIDPQWVLPRSVFKSLYRACKNGRVSKFVNLAEIGELIATLQEAAELESPEKQLRATDEIICSMVQ